MSETPQTEHGFYKTTNEDGIPFEVPESEPPPALVKKTGRGSGSTEMGEIPDELKTERERKTEIIDRRAIAMPERAGFSERAKQVLGKMSERGKAVMEKFYEKVTTSEMVNNVVDRASAWDFKRLAQQEQETLGRLEAAGTERTEAADRTMQVFEELKASFEKNALSLPEDAKTKIQGEVDSYRESAKKIGDRAAEVHSKMESYQGYQEAVLGRIDGRLAEKSMAEQRAKDMLTQKLAEYDENISNQMSCQKKCGESLADLKQLQKKSTSREINKVLSAQIDDLARKQADIANSIKKIQVEQGKLREKLQRHGMALDGIEAQRKMLGYAPETSKTAAPEKPEADTQPVGALETSAVGEQPVEPEVSAAAPEEEPPVAASSDTALAGDSNVGPEPRARETTPADEKEKITYKHVYDAWKANPPILGVSLDKAYFAVDSAVSKGEMRRNLGTYVGEAVKKLNYREALTQEENAESRKKDAEAIDRFLDKIFPETEDASEEREEVPENNKTTTDILKKWNDKPPIKNLSFRRDSIPKAVRDKVMLDTDYGKTKNLESKEDAVRFLEQIAVSIRGKNLTAKERNKILKFVEEAYSE